MEKRCQVCGKVLQKDEKRFCKTCQEFHQYKYPKKDLEKIVKEYEKWNKPKVLDIFAGCGGFSHGFLQSGFDVVGFVEAWEPAIESFQKNHKGARLIGRDVTTVTYGDLKEFCNKIDVIIGGPPCQGFSVCGKRDKKDKRNQLYKEFLRFVSIIKPKFAIMENVKGILSMKDSDGRLVFDKILQEFISLGYFVTYDVLTASDHGIAQKRQRVIIIAKRQNIFPKSTNEHLTVEDVLWDLPYEDNNLNGHICFNPTKETVEKIKHLDWGGKLSKNFNFSRQRLHPHFPSPTVVTKSFYVHPHYDRFLTPRELARLQSFPDTFEFCGTKTDMVRQIGNAVPPKLSEAIAKKIKTEVKRWNR